MSKLLEFLFDMLALAFSNQEKRTIIKSENKIKKLHKKLGKVRNVSNNNEKLTWKKNSNEKLNLYFNTNEFDCNCPKLCDTTEVYKEIISGLAKFRQELGMPIKINSAYRCKEHNANVGGVKTSTHTIGAAVDLYCKDLNKLAEIIEKTNPQYSIGRYDTFIHWDVRKDSRRWDERKFK